MSEDPRLHELIDALSDRSIDDADLAELNARLESDAPSRQTYLELMRVEAELGAIHLSPASAAPSEPSPAYAVTVSPASESPTASRRSSWSPWIGALAASILLTAASSSWLTYQGMRGEGMLANLITQPEPLDSEPPVEAVARVAATRNCRWSGTTAALGFGADVAGGQMLELEAGLAELTFADGARLVLEGPAAFRIADAETVELYSGRVAAAIPAEATGFSVRTPRLMVAESGAQYGLVAGSNGADEVHVFEGDIEAKSVDRHGHVTGVVNLASLEAARFRTSNHRFARFNADDEGFVRSLETRSGPGEGLLAFDNFSYPTGPLAWQNGGFGWAGPWADLEADDASDELDAARSNGVGRGSITTQEMISLGNRFVQSGNQNRVRRTLSTSLGGVFDAAGLTENADGLRLIGRNGSTVYISFLQRTSKLNDVFYGVELHRGDGNFNRVLCVGNGVDGHGYGVTSNFLTLGNTKFESLGEEDQRVNLIVMRIDFGDGDNDTATVYRNPSSLNSEASCRPAAVIRGAFAFDRVSLANFNGAKVHEVDELRIGTDFRAVTGRLNSTPIDLASLPSVDSLLIASSPLRFKANCPIAEAAMPKLY